MLGRPAQVQWLPVHHQQHRGGAGADDGLQQLQLPSGQLQGRPRRRLPDHALPFAGHHDRDLGRVGDAHGAAELRVGVKALGVLRPVVAEHVEHRGKHPLDHRDARCRLHPHPVPDLAPDAVEHGHRLVQVEVEHPGRGCRGASRPAARSPPPTRARRGPAATGRPGCAAGPRTARRRPGRPRVPRIGQHLAGAVLVDIGVVEQPQPQLGLQDPPHAGVEHALADRPDPERLGQVGVGDPGWPSPGRPRRSAPGRRRRPDPWRSRG